MKKSEWLKPLRGKSRQYEMYWIQSFGKHIIDKMPYAKRILLECLMRNYDGEIVTEKGIHSLVHGWNDDEGSSEIPFFPARVLMQDFTGVPAVADLAAMRDAAAAFGKDPLLVNPKVPVDLIIDHSIQIDHYGTHDALEKNVCLEYDRNSERYSLLKWAQNSFSRFRVVPPNSGICHQVNLEFLAEVVKEQAGILYPDTLVGTDSHTTMINSLGVLGWGVGGIEAEAVMLGQPYFMQIPKVAGVRFTGTLPPLCTATDLVLTVTKKLRDIGVVGWFVEFFGPGLKNLDIPDRATTANMCPEYGATAGFFPIDSRTIEYLHATGRAEAAERTKVYTEANSMFYNEIEPEYDAVIHLPLETVEPCIAGPARPQDNIPLSKAGEIITPRLQTSQPPSESAEIVLHGETVVLTPGTVVIAAITSCTNTSNPAVMLGAALLAKHAVEKGLKVPPWVKTSLAPGSKSAAHYLQSSQLMPCLETLGFHIAAYGCTTCIGNSGPLHPEVEHAQKTHNLPLAAVLSGNRNFEGRIHRSVSDSYLMSPMLVIAYALAGTVAIDLHRDPLGTDQHGNNVFLHDIWPDPEQIRRLISDHISEETFTSQYADIFTGDAKWNDLSSPAGAVFSWNADSSYIVQPPFFKQLSEEVEPLSAIHHARALLVLGDSVTTDHISPAGNIDPSYPAGTYLKSLGIDEDAFNSYGSRRGNHEVMVRGTFANTRIRQELTSPKTGGITKILPQGTIAYVYDAAEAYKSAGIPLIILAGKEYGTGSSRDWAAKGTRLLGVKAVIAESFERIHRSNLVGMGILPLTYAEHSSRSTLGLTGQELFTVKIEGSLIPGQELEVEAQRPDGSIMSFTVCCRLDSPIEAAYFRHGGILPYVLKELFF